MESTAFFEKKINLTPTELNEIKKTPIEELLIKKAKSLIENKCSEQGFVLPGSVKLLSRSMGYFESARFTGDVIYYVKLEGQVIYPIDGTEIEGEVIRKNKMGLYINYRDAIRIQIPRDLHLGNLEYDNVDIGDRVMVELKRSKFAINDPYILASGLFISSLESNPSEQGDEKEEEDEKDNQKSDELVQQEEDKEEEEDEVADEVEEEEEVADEDEVEEEEEEEDE
jgi:hypothetical protein